MGSIINNKIYDDQKKWIVRIEIGVREIVKKFNGVVNIDIESGIFDISVDAEYKVEVALSIADFMSRIQRQIEEAADSIDKDSDMDYVWIEKFGWVV